MRVPTSLQQETWIRSLAAGGRLRAMPALLSVQGDLDLPRYRAAVSSLEDAHDTLRMTFRADEPTAAWVVDVDREPAEMPYLDGREEPLVWDEVRDYLTRPFPLDGSRRIRTFVVRTADDTYLLGLAADHLAMDGLSLRLLARDILARYAPAAGRRPDPPPYSAFARRQRELLAGRWGAERKAFWYHHFDRWGPNQPGSPLAVPPPSGVDWTTGRTMVTRAVLGPRTAETLDGCARTHGSTRFGVLAAAVSRQQIVGSGAPVAGVVTDFHGRVVPSTWATLGLFSHGLNLFLDRSEADDLPGAVRTLTDRLEAAQLHGIPVRPFARSWLAERGEQQRYGEPNFIYLGVRPRLKRYLPTVAGAGLRATPVDVGLLINHALGNLMLVLDNSGPDLVLEARYNEMLFPPSDVEVFVRAALESVGQVDLDVTTRPRAEMRTPAPHGVS